MNTNSVNSNGENIHRAIAISDANVIIDMELGGLESAMFCLPEVEYCIPDVLFEKELRQHHSHFMSKGLKLCSLPSKAVAEVFRLSQLHPKPSKMDLFALVLAQEKQAMLLTGDQYLRKVAETYGVECHGTVWLVEQLVKGEIITTEIARLAYRNMFENGSRLPWLEAEERLKKMEFLMYA
ncbi:hypothetical protein [Parachlamydia sp. AcF125]|uniref:hypothetical protein n=1 Tax=Parachlamydia sp. AcF125 TaxID=2795736 RepID=UPI001BC8FA2E|nr:hypothetical protein [Parachlamydia sp. AcF125]MBS4168612.1 hypothetical protein [Parachlamydia sp. AcF125]